MNNTDLLNWLVENRHRETVLQAVEDTVMADLPDELWYPLLKAILASDDTAMVMVQHRIVECNGNYLRRLAIETH